MEGITFPGRQRARSLDSQLVGSETHGYDIRNDQALPNLQTAINQKNAYRDRAMRLRETRLAGVRSVRASGLFFQASSVAVRQPEEICCTLEMPEDSLQPVRLARLVIWQ